MTLLASSVILTGPEASYANSIECPRFSPKRPIGPFSEVVAGAGGDVAGVVVGVGLEGAEDVRLCANFDTASRAASLATHAPRRRRAGITPVEFGSKGVKPGGGEDGNVRKLQEVGEALRNFDFCWSGPQRIFGSILVYFCPFLD